MTFKRNRTSVRKKNDKQAKWFVFDAQGKILGRLAAEIAKVSLIYVLVDISVIWLSPV